MHHSTYRSFEGAVRHVGGEHPVRVEQHGVVLRAEDDGVLEEDGERVELLEGEVEHDPLRHERVAVVLLPREDGEPDAHPVRAAVEPEAVGQVRLRRVGRPREPYRLAARGQDGGKGLERTIWTFDTCTLIVYMKKHDLITCLSYFECCCP